MDIKQILADVQFLINVLVVAVMAVVECHVGICLHSACTVFQGQVVVVVPFVVLPRLSGRHQTESVALCFQGLDADDGIHLGIILGSWGGDDIHAFDICRLQLLQLYGVAYLFVINIDFRLPFCQYLVLTVAGFHKRQHRQ